MITGTILQEKREILESNNVNIRLDTPMFEILLEAKKVYPNRYEMPIIKITIMALNRNNVGNKIVLFNGTEEELLKLMNPEEE